MESDDDFGKDDWDSDASTKPTPLDRETSDKHRIPKMTEEESETFNLCLVHDEYKYK
jgi:hypothetical protein